MNRKHRVGTFTTGLLLIIFGVLYLLKIFFPSINYYFILSLWPLILIFIGIEIIAAYIMNKDENIKYDTGAIILSVFLSFFAMGIAFMQFIAEHADKFISINF
ncbi:hypothetical protein AGR56_00625 [Clostridium sp. DMHC 10]|uniref:LiaI-LiaF-like domain-containing protein n=1 Tax=Clostridium sp. DMHC 10 TaxID=747377 RepID=UPI00069EBEC9|nr:DUF5668 domain-containing protein [Clostridium sp. DMHC 10]KOF58187.1 hypothetical protein AGR56_00625 [Clostridium sp. DMHC 10]